MKIQPSLWDEDPKPQSKTPLFDGQEGPPEAPGLEQIAKEAKATLRRKEEVPGLPWKRETDSRTRGKREAEKAKGEEAESSLATLLRKSVQMKVEEDSSSPHIMAIARAGTGKTTTLVEGLKVVKGEEPRITPSEQQAEIWKSMGLSRGAKNVCFSAFNKGIALELQRRVPKGCDAMTLHSMGVRVVSRAFNHPELDDYKIYDILADLLGENSRALRQMRPTFCNSVRELSGLCKKNMMEGNEEELTLLADHYDIDIESFDETCDLIPRILERCKDPRRDGCIDFDDMIWLPIVMDLPIYRYDLLLVDEAQDMNRCQHAMILRAGKRLVLCGDPCQAIYGFSGADSESMQRIEGELKSRGRGTATGGPGVLTLPLTVTRRCGHAITAEARKIVPDFEAFPTNPKGAIHEDLYERGEYAQKVKDGDMILCRINAPLISQCLRFIKAGRRAYVQGRDVSRTLISTIERMKAESVEHLVGKISDWLYMERAKELAKRNPSEVRLIALQDRHDCVIAFTEGAHTVEEVIQRVKDIFTDSREQVGIRCASVHKAKGLEADNVFILQPPGCGMPHPMARTPWQKQQEENLRYVAITRAIHNLTYVN